MARRFSLARVLCLFAALTLVGAALALVSATSASAAVAPPAYVELVSVNSAGNQANDASTGTVISRDGRYVLFTSSATNLVASPTGAASQVFLRDRQTGSTELESVNAAGVVSSGAAGPVGISADGRYVLMVVNNVDSLIAGLDPNSGSEQLVLRDRQTGQLEIESVNSAGNPQTSGTFWGTPQMTPDARYIVFASSSGNLVPDDTNAQQDVFVHDRQTGTTERIDVDPAGNQVSVTGGFGFAGVLPSISADGRYVAFQSDSDAVVANDSNGHEDVFVRDRQTNTTQLVSVSSEGVQGNSDSHQPVLDADGGLVEFHSLASNLVPGDTNNGGDDFVHNLATGVTERVSVDSAGNQATSTIYEGTISGDGRYVEFPSVGQTFPTSITANEYVFYVRDLATDTTFLASAPAGGGAPTFGDVNNGLGRTFAFSYDASVVAFESAATNLVPNDTNDLNDVFAAELTDVRAPTVSMQAPNDGAVFAQGQAVPAAYSCTDGAGGSGVASCVGTVADGAAIDTSTAGAHTFSVATSDNAGNSTTSSVNYTVVAPVNVGTTLPTEGGTLSTDPDNTGPTPTAPLQTAVSAPTGGDVSIAQSGLTAPTPTGFSLGNLQVDITAPSASAAAPLALTFSLDDTLVASMGGNLSDVVVFRNGAAIGECLNPSVAAADPDPCVFERTERTGFAEIGVYSSHASTWNFGTLQSSSCSGACISAGDASILEGDSGSRALTFSVTLSHPATTTVTVNYTITNGTATGGSGLTPPPGSDFKLKSGVITFKPGLTTKITPILKTVSAAVLGDTTPEPDQTLLVTLSNPTGSYGIVKPVGVGTILNDDGIAPGVTLGIGDSATTVASSGNQTLKVPVTLSAKLGGTVTITYTISPGTATYSKKSTGGGDFGGALLKTLTFLPGATTKALLLPIWPHTGSVPTKSFTIKLSNLTGTGVTVIRDTGIATIYGNT